MTLVYLSGNRIEGLSGDTKPTTAQNKAVFFETDTVKTFDFNLSSTTWTERSSGGGISGDSILPNDITSGNYSNPSTAIGTSIDTTSATVSGFHSSWTPDTVKILDGDKSTNEHGKIRTYSNPTGVIIIDFGTSGNRNFETKVGVLLDSVSLSMNIDTTVSYSTDGVSYTTYSTVNNTTPSVEQIYETSFTVTARYIKLTFTVNGGYSYRYNSIYTYHADYIGRPSVLSCVDDNSSTYWESNQEINPNVYVDMGSSTITSQVLINPRNVTTETELLIQTSDDAITWNTKRTILTSKLTNSQDNFIRMNPHLCRYVRVYGNSGNSRVISLYKIKVKKSISLSSDDNLSNHAHLDIDSTNTSLGLDGE